jgi:hypothetical protein
LTSITKVEWQQGQIASNSESSFMMDLDEKLAFLNAVGPHPHGPFGARCARACSVATARFEHDSVF